MYLYQIGPEPKPEMKGDTRTFRVWLDTNQYQKDMEAVVRGSEVRATHIHVHEQLNCKHIQSYRVYLKSTFNCVC